MRRVSWGNFLKAALMAAILAPAGAAAQEPGQPTPPAPAPSSSSPFRSSAPVLGERRAAASAPQSAESTEPAGPRLKFKAETPLPSRLDFDRSEDQIQIRGGQVLTGKILSENESVVTFKTAKFGVIRIPRQNVLQIAPGGKIEPAAPAPSLMNDTGAEKETSSVSRLDFLGNMTAQEAAAAAEAAATSNTLSLASAASDSVATSDTLSLEGAANDAATGAESADPAAVSETDGATPVSFGEIAPRLKYGLELAGAIAKIDPGSLKAVNHVIDRATSRKIEIFVAKVVQRSAGA